MKRRRDASSLAGSLAPRFKKGTHTRRRCASVVRRACRSGSAGTWGRARCACTLYVLEAPIRILMSGGQVDFFRVPHARMDWGVRVAKLVNQENNKASMQNQGFENDVF